ncbi:MAG: alanine racemase [Chlorobiales bacterium]|nr:alanine racemase [Chlorobiales bacterium]
MIDNDGQFPPVNLSEALISLKNLRHNAQEVRRKIGPDRRIMAIVKANAYGHNADRVADALLDEGITDFGVANINEALRLRRGARFLKNDCRILAFASPLLPQLEYYLKHDIDLTIGSVEALKTAEAIAAKFGKPFTVHLKVDTGMGRLGICPDEALSLANAIHASEHLHLKGIYTHFSVSGEDKAFTKKQLGIYKTLVSEFEHQAETTVLKHAANSGAIISDSSTYLDMVRPGILLYGYKPDSSLRTSLDLKPVMQFQARVIFTKWVEKGTPISYGRRWTAKQRTYVATVSVGYADGYHRALSNVAKVAINGKLYKQIGTVTMDQIMVSLGHDTSVKVGDKVVLFGWDGLGATVLAEKIGTIGYELLCAVSPRVQRVFID